MLKKVPSEKVAMLLQIAAQLQHNSFFCAKMHEILELEDILDKNHMYIDRVLHATMLLLQHTAAYWLKCSLF